MELVYNELFRDQHSATPTEAASSSTGITSDALLNARGIGTAGGAGPAGDAAGHAEGLMRGGVFRVNTHGGLLGFGAPWEVPAMHSLIEAVAQLRGEAVGRQVAGAKRALVYGNGGIFSASAVAVLEVDHGDKGQTRASKL